MNLPLPLGRASVAPVAAAARPAVFLHSFWRSRGTWLWSSFRQDAGVVAFYEPLHEDLHRLTAAGIERWRPTAWISGHGATRPYFAEYAELLRERGRGVPRYRRRFAFDRFFAGPEDADPELEDYLGSLIEAAAPRRAVLKFCRSLGRVGWMRARFPEALHLVVLRDPQSQWLSARQQLITHHNDYFVIVPFLILARNAGHPLVRAALGSIPARLPPLLGSDIAVALDMTRRHVRRLSWAERYRGYLAFWTAASLAALRGGGEPVDSNRLATDGGSRTALCRRMAAAGLDFALEPGEAPAPAAALSDETLRVHAAALRVVEAERDRLPPGGAELLGALLAPDGAALPEPAMIAAMAAAPGPIGAAMLRTDAALYVAAKRLSFPLRWLHGEARRRWLG